MAVSSNGESAISVPTGGGAVQGIGEKFSPDLFTGTGNFSVPIIVPQGRNGFQPLLNLTYSSGHGNGPYGHGFALSIPSVSRKTHPVPRGDRSDIFILSGSEDLVPTELHGNQQYYQPRTEGLFARIAHITGAQDYWEVATKDGLISTYGDATAGGHSTVCDPDDASNPNRIFSWMLSETRDPFSNLVRYEYMRDRVRSGSCHWDQNYIKRILYADYTEAQETKFLVSVEFYYDDETPPHALSSPVKARPDPFSQYRAGFEIRTRRRCALILVRSHPLGAPDVLIRAYRLIYLDERTDLPAAERVPPANGLSLLSRIEMIAYDDAGAPGGALPPLDFGYTAFQPERRKFVPASLGADPVPSLADRNVELVDIHGGGLPDLVTMNGTVQFRRNLGGGRFAPMQPMHESPLGLSLDDPGVQLLDVNGDGRADLVVNDAHASVAYTLEFGPKWKRRPSEARQAPPFKSTDPEVRLLDLDGDGVTDALRTGERFECFFQDEKKGWNAIRTVTRQPLADFPDVTFADAHVKLAALSGSGMHDIALVQAGSLSYWPNLGHGNWGGRITMPIQPALPADYDPRRVLLGDIDGDGYADLVYVDSGRVLIWFNQSGNSWSTQPLEIRGVPPVAEGDALRVADLYGAGVSGILWGAGPANPARQRMNFLDLTGGIKPYLLDRMSNNLGATSRVQYVPSTKFYLEDDKCSATRWRTPLPFPVQVVSKVEVIDHLSGGKHTTEYQYRGGYWDGPEKEFRGFAEVRQLSSEGFIEYHGAGLHGVGTAFSGVPTQYFSPPTLLKTFFHQGPVGDEYGDWEELDHSGDYWACDPSLLEAKKGVDDFLRNYCTAIYPHARRDMRDALRALRGSVLRTELYALDGSESQNRPYTVTEHAYELREESAPAAPQDAGRKRIFFPHEVARRTTQWERGSDPLTVFSFSSEYDPFGNPCRQVSIACPRGWRAMSQRPGNPYLATLTLMEYAAPAANGPYIRDRAARIRSYEITSTTGMTAGEVAATNPGAAALKVFAETVNFYDADPAAADYGAFTGLGYGKVGLFGALTRSETLVMTEAEVAAAYGIATLPYLTQQTAITPSADYPAAFVAMLPARAGYVFKAGGGTSPQTRGYFRVSASRKYDFHSAAGTGRGLLLAQRDPLGNETTIGYEAHGLFSALVSSPRETGAQFVAVSATYDYRAMQPRSVTDPNGNVTLISYTPEGLVGAISVSGKAGAGEGDQATPGVRFEYALRTYYDSMQADPAHPKPVYARTIRRVHHDSDPDDRGETIESREYSDGYGRLLQTRVQDDSVRFGNAHFGGGGPVLDADHTAGAMTAVIGTENLSNVAPNVRVSGTQRYDNKGEVVEKWEPFFDAGWDCAAPATTQLGQKISLYYDPRGQVVRTVNPDGSEQRIVYGVPADIADPPLSPVDTDKFSPSAWAMWTYDANDNAGRTHAAMAGSYSHHWNTPASIEIDALGRIVRAVARYRSAPGAPIEEHATRSNYDIQGNLTRVHDALGRLAFEYYYDLVKQPLRSESIDAGSRTTVLDAAGGLVEKRDSKGSLALHGYDALGRPVRLWARDAAADQVTLREERLYGDSAGAPLAGNSNRLGRLYRRYDEAGLAETSAYDFKGNVLRSSRRALSDDFMLSVINDPTRTGWSLTAPRVDWDSAVPPELDAATYETRSAYDALSRIKWSEYPECTNGERYRIEHAYNRAGALKSLTIAGPLDAAGTGPSQVYVERIAYNAKGQRVLIAYGNGLMTRYAHDAQTFRLTRLRTDPYAKQGQLGYAPQAEVLQDIAYAYDLAGNILSILHRTPGCGVRGGGAPGITDAALLRRFEYDPLYRLVYASGREASLIPAPRPWHELATANRSSDVVSGVYISATPPKITQANAPDMTSLYEERYEYDPAGNMLKLTHGRNGAAGWSRHFGMAGFTPKKWRQNITDFLAGASPAWGSAGNRLTNCGNHELQATSHAFDANGNMIGENNERRFEWDHADRMKVFRIQTGASLPSCYALYLYDTNGTRVKKLVWESPGNYHTTTYLGGTFERHQRTTPGKVEGNNSLHVMEGPRRIAVVRIGDAFDDDGAKDHPVQYQLEDHLGSSSLVAGEDGSWVSREEFYPYGETSFGSFRRKRYRFGGKERDEESGLNYHGARYYAPWKARWANCDPAGAIDGSNLYAFCRNTPLCAHDALGLAGDNEPVADQGTPGVAANLLGAKTEGYGNAALKTRGIEFRPNVVIDASGVEVPAGEGVRAPRPPDSQEFDAFKTRGPDVDWKGVGKTETPPDYVSKKATEIADQQFTHMTVRGKSQTAVVVTYNLSKEQMGALRTELQTKVSARVGELKDALKGLNNKLYNKVKDLKVSVGVTSVKSLTSLTLATAKQTAKALLPAELSIPYDHLKLVGGGSAATGARVVLQYGTTTFITEAGTMVSEAAVTVGAAGASVLGALSCLAAPFIFDPRIFQPDPNRVPIA